MYHCMYYYTSSTLSWAQGTSTTQHTQHLLYTCVTRVQVASLYRTLYVRLCSSVRHYLSTCLGLIYHLRFYNTHIGRAESLSISSLQSTLPQCVHGINVDFGCFWQLIPCKTDEFSTPMFQDFYNFLNLDNK